jgi:hypothetical protein
MKVFFADSTCLQCIVLLYECKCSTLKIRVHNCVVGISTRFRLDGPGIETQWRWDFPHLDNRPLRHIQLPVPWVQGLIPRGKATGAKRPGRGVDHPPPSSAEVLRSLLDYHWLRS